MIVKSFIKDYFGLRPVDVEIVLTAGLPQISILGLPDQVISECTKRIQTALVAHGFQMPKAKQVLVNLWPREIRKSSLGIDLAIALGILAESGQKNIFESFGKNTAVYGELTLSGEVRAPKDIESLAGVAEFLEGPIITGGPVKNYEFPVAILENLGAEAVLSSAANAGDGWQRPPFKYHEFSKDVAELLLVTAVGEHSLLLAGPPGSGKTSFTESVSPLLKNPTRQMFRESKNIARYFNDHLSWRPVVVPHHTTPAISILGGGVPLKPGQIVRAHGGVLVLDELLEFDGKVQSALRETLETGKIQLSRGVQWQEFPSNFITLATTNLCRCGEYVPLVSNRCRCSGLKLRQYTERLSGPFIDRLTLLQFTHQWGPSQGALTSATAAQAATVSAENLLKRASEVYEFVERTRQQTKPNEQLSLNEIFQNLESKSLLQVFESFRSHRRQLAFWRTARSFADIDFCEKISERHLVKSQVFTLKNFSDLKSLSS